MNNADVWAVFAARKKRTLLFITPSGELFTAIPMVAPFYWVIAGPGGTGVKRMSLKQLKRYGRIIDRWEES